MMPNSCFAKCLSTKGNTDHPDIIAWPPLIFLSCVVAGTVLHFLLPIRVMRYSASLSLGVVLAVVSASLAIWLNG